jgi:AmmeMemoRadiSam system protein B/AmmeMemoRadiSam system protein A
MHARINAVLSLVVASLFLFPGTSSCGRLRKPVFAGTWYPGEAGELRDMVRLCMEGASGSLPAGEIIGLVSPHAGYLYSGKVAGYAYRLVRGRKYDAVILVGPSHRYAFHGASVYSSGAWETPLGTFRIDETLAKSILGKSPLLSDIEEAHAKEHSLEIQLPFVREALGDVPIVPIVMGDQDLETARSLGGAIASAVKGKKCLLIASSDLSHYHSGEVADRMDALFTERLSALDAVGIAKGLESGIFEACGGGPVMAVLIASMQLGAGRVEILKRADSGDITGDKSSVVGYLAAAVLAGKEKQEGESKMGENLVTPEDQRYLHEIVKEVIGAKLEGRAPEIRARKSPVLEERRGAFVTLTIEGRLRGCMGQLVPTGSLVDVVKEMALAAAFSDPRFTPLTREEFEKVEIEISVLTPLERTDDPEKIEVGKHGIYIRKGFQSGVLLPQVAADQGWDRQEFLDATCRKAGLPGKCWKEGEAEIYIFTAQIF